MRPTMLLAEDNPELLRLHALRFELEGYSVFTATDGQEAMEVLDGSAPPTCIVTDWVMPRVDGLQLCRHVRNRSEFDDIPIVLLTAYRPTPEIQQLVDAGQITYLSKATPWPEVMKTVRALLANPAYASSPAA